MSVGSWSFAFIGLILMVGVEAKAGDFIVLSDLPYTEDQQRVFEDQIIPAIKADLAPFVIHVGDFKGSKEVCSDGLFLAVRDTLYGLKPGRVFLTPGDNDWTDCDRDSTGLAMREYDRLSRLRQIFFEPAPESPEEMHVMRQDGYPENARWVDDGVTYVTLHVVGTNNGRAQILLDDVDFALAQVSAREQANRVWLEGAVEQAREAQAKALVIAMQADVTEPWGSGSCEGTTRIKCDAFAMLRDQVRLAAQQFRGPVLLIHGDSDPYCLDQEFGGDQAPNLWRLNSAGDYAVIDAVKVTVQPDSTTPFMARTLVSGQAPRQGC
ncbi:MAG: hypothetical protein CMM78_11640 [Rhodospirillaceae bacterium]|jgi:pimeloyl-ACP methyl ester carboxylesterase|uniref:hypothetical protein n=1 Tax=Hwanghaeella sp. 1Z406 TaxID=3402811 RepID=UPI000C38C78D|nr:hypothetical protein [Rhodospirillales bacterium]MAX48854.1 hypothetical protein [Rhodospirillaceae bacterium]